MEIRRIGYSDYKKSGLEAVKNSYDKESKTIEVSADDKTAKVLQVLSGKEIEVSADDRRALYGYLAGVYGWSEEEIEVAIRVFA